MIAGVPCAGLRDEEMIDGTRWCPLREISDTDTVDVDRVHRIVTFGDVKMYAAARDRMCVCVA